MEVRNLFYLLLGLQGYLEHSDGRCVSVDGNELRLTPCSMPDTISPDNIFYKTSPDSPLYHAVSGKCIKKPQDGQVKKSSSYLCLYLF